MHPTVFNKFTHKSPDGREAYSNNEVLSGKIQYGARCWVESFSQLVKSYNHTIRSALPKDMTPAQVNLKNEHKVWLHLYQNDFSTTHA